jgi:hypothetical protein
VKRCIATFPPCLWYEWNSFETDRYRDLSPLAERVDGTFEVVVFVFVFVVGAGAGAAAAAEPFDGAVGEAVLARAWLRVLVLRVVMDRGGTYC